MAKHPEHGSYRATISGFFLSICAAAPLLGGVAAGCSGEASDEGTADNAGTALDGGRHEDQDEGVRVGSAASSVREAGAGEQDHGRAGAGQPENGAATSIDALGGTVRGPDGVVLDVPAGALSTSVQITIVRLDGHAPAGLVAYSPVYRFGPEGLAFATSVKAKLPFLGDAALAKVYWTRKDSSDFAEIPAEVGGQSAQVSIEHFSHAIVAGKRCAAGQQLCNGRCSERACEPRGDRSSASGSELGAWSKSVAGGVTIWQRTIPAPIEDGVCAQSFEDDTKLICFGTGSGPADQPPWACKDASATNRERVCQTPSTSEHSPPDMSAGTCTALVKAGQLVQTCEERKQALNAMPRPGSPCSPGARRWCDGLSFCGWGIITCPESGTWPTTTRTLGRTQRAVEDCREDTDGRRPNTLCARHHWFFNPECCEREDCLIPDETSTRAPAKSPGNLCDPCSPSEPECKEPGALCVYRKKMVPPELIGWQTFPTGETFCGRECAADRQCPAGFTCSRACAVNFYGAPSCGHQCVPEKDGSCYARALKQ